jgi:hypothetical protein
VERAGIPRKVAMEISGHRTESVYRRYDIVSKRDLMNAALKLERYLENEHQSTQQGNKKANTERAN